MNGIATAFYWIILKCITSKKKVKTKYHTKELNESSVVDGKNWERVKERKVDVQESSKL